MTKISFVKCENYEAAQEAVRNAVSHMGGISNFVKRGERILIKPNLLAPKDPSLAVTTHPEIVRAVIRLVKEAGATPLVGDSPGGSLRDINNLWKITGMRDVCYEEGAELIKFEAGAAQTIGIDNENIGKIAISKAIFDCDGIINLPKLKTHSLMAFTAGIKNLYGCIPGLLKVEYHKYASKTSDFADLLLDIYKFLKPKIRFTLIDAIAAMDGNGPSAGNVKNLNFIAASSETEMLDAFVLCLLDYDLSKHHIFKKLNISKRLVGKSEFVGDSLENFFIAGFNFPKTALYGVLPNFIVKMLGSLLWIKPEIDNNVCRKCFICGKICPMKAISVYKNESLHIDKEKCISCFCCHEMCPHKAIEFKKSFCAKLFIQDDRT